MNYLSSDSEVHIVIILIWLSYLVLLNCKHWIHGNIHSTLKIQNYWLTLLKIRDKFTSLWLNLMYTIYYTSATYITSPKCKKKGWGKTRIMLLEDELLYTVNNIKCLGGGKSYMPRQTISFNPKQTHHHDFWSNVWKTIRCYHGYQC